MKTKLPMKRLPS